MNKFVVTIPAYNAEKYIQRAIRSATNQKYDNFRIIAIDDCSTDDTLTKYENFIHNTKRIGPLANHYKMAQMCDDDEIIVNLDGDDELAHPNVLSMLNEVYQDPDVWMTYGSYEYDYESRNPAPGADVRGIVQPIPADRHARDYPFVCSHLRTYKKWLFDRIKKEDLMYGGRFYQWAMDHALMYPMIEMSGPQHARYIHDILYLYNATNPINEHKMDQADKLIMESIDHIKSRPVYPQLAKEKDYLWI